MDSQRTNRVTEEIVKVESGGNDDDSIQSLPELPTEVWTRIFENVTSGQGQQTERNKTMAGLQLVCKTWRTMIRDHVYFEVNINDELLNGTKPFENVRVQKCTLANLTMEPSAIAKLYKPNLIKEITLGGNVNESHFFAVAVFLECVETVIITPEFLDCSDDLFENNDLKNAIYKRFWSSVTKLELNVPLIDLGREDSRPVINLVKFLESAHLSNLMEFKLTAHWSLIMNHLPFSFLVRHKSSVAIVSLKLAEFQNEDDMINMRSYNRKPSDNDFDKSNLAKVQLKKLTLEGGGMDKASWYIWAPLLEAQHNMAQLEICNIDAPELGDFYNPLSFTIVNIVGMRNYSTITSIQLNQFKFNRVADLNCFRLLHQLKYVKLDKKNDGSETKLVNITCLPKSIEVFIVKGLICEWDDLLKFVRARHLKKLRHILLVAEVESREEIDNIAERLNQALEETHGPS